MKSTGLTRKIDSLGRIVLPMELRKHYDWPEGTPIEIFTKGDAIVLKRYDCSCVFCNTVEPVVTFNGQKICHACLAELSATTPEKNC